MKALKDAKRRRLRRKGKKDNGGDTLAAIMAWEGGFVSSNGCVRYEPEVRDVATP